MHCSIREPLRPGGGAMHPEVVDLQSRLRGTCWVCGSLAPRGRHWSWGGRQDSGRHRKARNGECAAGAERRGGDCWNCRFPSGFPASPWESADSSPLGPPLGPQSPPARNVGAAPRPPSPPPVPRESCSVTASADFGPGVCLGSSAPAARSLPRRCAGSAAGSGQQAAGTRSARFVRGSSCGLWSLQSFLFPQGRLFCPEFSKRVGSRVSDPGLCAPRLSFPVTGNSP